VFVSTDRDLPAGVENPVATKSSLFDVQAMRLAPGLMTAVN